MGSAYLLGDEAKARKLLEGDPGHGPEVTAKLEAAFTAAGVAHAIELYPGASHGFVPTDTPVHSAEAAERHWQRLFTLFDETPKG